MDIKEMILFPTFVYGVDNFLNEKDRNKLLKDVLKEEKKINLDHRFHTNGMDHTKKIYNCLSEKIKTLSKNIFDHHKLIYNDFEITGMWSNVIKQNNDIQIHNHPNNFLSGVYYLQTDDNSPNIVFTDPRQQSNVITPKASERTIHNSSAWWFKPKQNSILFFPSWLQHYVEQNKSKEKRISIAFNIMFNGIIGCAKNLTQSTFK